VVLSAEFCDSGLVKFGDPMPGCFQAGGTCLCLLFKSRSSGMRLLLLLC
jgi:hypothetical protein